MRPPSDSDAEAIILTTAAGRALLDEVADVARPLPADLQSWRQAMPAALVAAALRLADCRRRGALKFARADRMWLEATALEQATAEAVARHKARRFAGAMVVDLCAGLGGDALALAGVARGVLAVELDPGHLRRLAWNAEVYDVADRLLPVRGRAEDRGFADSCLIHIDPDRRARAGTRARSIRDYVPNLDYLRRLDREAPGGAIKLSPASDFDEHFPDAEVELINHDGECKEATAWFGTLAGCRRRATVLPSGLTWTDRDAPIDARAPIVPLSTWIFDPETALIRSGLLDGFAVAHGLSRFAEGIDLLTGPSRVDSPFLTAFEVLELLPLDLKRLRRLVADRGLGPLEIKTRGLDLRPEMLRKQLKPIGPNPATLILVGGPEKGRAILAHRALTRTGGA